MPATSAYQAGFETTNTQISYGAETVWGTVPAVQFQAIRYTGESLSSQKQRNRPAEVAPITSVLEVQQAVTTQVAAGGGINFALTYSTYDELLSGGILNDWQTAVVLAGVAADITITNGSPVQLTSTTAGKFTNIAAGQWIRTLGFTNAANNQIWYVSAKANAQTLSLVSPLGTAAVTETPAGTAAQVRASTIVNADKFKSYYLQQQYSATAYLRYPGSFVSGFTLSGGVGQFLNGSFTFLSQSESSATANASTGAVLAAPTGAAHDPVSGFVGAFLDRVAVGSVVESFSIQVQMQGAALEYGMGSTAAQGIIMGVLQASGQMRVYFKDFTLYARYTAETQGMLSFITKDAAGNAYVVSLLNAALMNPRIEVGGPGQAVMAVFDIEANPIAGGGTIRLDRLPAT